MNRNGADMAALFPQKCQNVVDKIITLDNRGMALPKMKNFKVYSLWSSGQPADEGVLPTKKDRKVFRIKIVKLENTTLDKMDESANGDQREEIQDYVSTFLNEK
jgi:hypothetical protein